MGIYDRDYTRASYGRRQLWGGDLPVVKTLLAINIVLYVLQVIAHGTGDAVTNFLDLDPAKLVGSFQVWRLLTYAFCHDPTSPWHILFNMLFLWWFGSELERMYGSREFAWFYASAAVVSAACFLLFEWLRPSGVPAVGASGAIMATVMLYAIHFPRQVIMIMGIIPVQLWMVVLFYIIFDLHPVLLSLGGAQKSDHIAHTAHLGGLAFGFLYYALNLRLTRLLGNRSFALPQFRKPRMFKSAPDLRVYREESDPQVHDAIDERVDALLAKISEHGEASLTDDERRVLFEASRRYRKRRS